MTSETRRTAISALPLPSAIAASAPAYGARLDTAQRFDEIRERHAEFEIEGAPIVITGPAETFSPYRRP